MARGLCKPWKQPIFVDFDKKMSKSVLDEILIELHNSGHIVVAMTSDTGGSNVDLWKELNFTPDASWFDHPITKEPIVYSPDVPHLLKLLRNWLLDNGFELQDGKIVHKLLPIVKLCGLVSKKEVSSVYKLTEDHIKCAGTQRQNVDLATQLISNNVGCALIRYLSIFIPSTYFRQGECWDIYTY